MGDKFSDVTSKAVERVAIGGAAIAGNALGGPGMALTLSVGTFTLAEWFRAMSTGGDSRVLTQRLDAFETEIAQLEARLAAAESAIKAAGEQPDRQDLLSKEGIFSDFARGVSEARTPPKRHALVNATVHQFDPRKGTPATRDYWLRRVRETSDAELALVNLLSVQTEITFWRNEAFATSATNNANAPATVPLTIPKSTVVAFETIAQQVANQGPGQLVYSAYSRHVRSGEGADAHAVRAYGLTAAGEIFVSFCKDD